MEQFVAGGIGAGPAFGELTGKGGLWGYSASFGAEQKGVVLAGSDGSEADRAGFFAQERGKTCVATGGCG